MKKDINTELKESVHYPLQLLQRINALLPSVAENQKKAQPEDALLAHVRRTAPQHSPAMQEVLQFLRENSQLISDICDKIIEEGAFVANDLAVENKDDQLKSALVIKALVMSLLLPADTGISLNRLTQAIDYLAEKKFSHELSNCLTEFQKDIANVNNIFSTQSGLFFCYYFKKQIPQKLFFSLDITVQSLPVLLNEYHQKFLSNAEAAGYEQLWDCFYSSEYQLQGDPRPEKFDAKRRELFQALRPIMLQQLFAVIDRIAKERGVNDAADLLRCAQGHAFFTAPDTDFVSKLKSFIGHQRQPACQLAISAELEKYTPAHENHI